MFTTAILLSMIPAFFILNRVRGSRIDQIIGRDIPVLKNGAPIAAVGLAAYIYVICQYDPIIAIAAGIAYAAGESFGWSKWYEGMAIWRRPDGQYYYNLHIAKKDTGKSNGIDAIASKFFDETKNFKAYCVTALIIRGMYWWIPVFAVLGYFGGVTLTGAIVGPIALAVGFPLSYYIGDPAAKTGINGGQEKYYGAVQGAVLAITLAKLI